MRPSRLNSFFDYSVGAGRLFGIPIRLHITLIFFLLAARPSLGWGIWHGLELAAGIVLSILLHELGHGLTAKYYKMSGLSIMLHGFGGFATSHGYRTPKQALAIVLAGPAVTFALAVAFLGLGNFLLQGADYGSETIDQAYVMQALGHMNLLLGFLNMVPMLPFDGGNALRAILSFRLTDHKATRAVAHLGLLICPVMAVYGFLANQSFVGIFGLMGAITSYVTLANSGGVRFGEVFVDRRSRKEVAATKAREQIRQQTYLDDVNHRIKEREERARLRKLLEASTKDD